MCLSELVGGGTDAGHGRFLWSFLAVAFLLAVVFLVVVASSGVGGQTKSQTRNYFIAADEVAWNYAPAGTNVFSGAPFDEEANKCVQAGPDRIGSTHTKCLYRAYTDTTFTQRIPRRDDEQYLGMLGPVIRAQVGDTIKVTFRNNCSFPASIHPHGVFYDKKYEGAAYTTADPQRIRPVTRWPRTSSTSTPERSLIEPARVRWTVAR